MNLYYFQFIHKLLCNLCVIYDKNRKIINKINNFSIKSKNGEEYEINEIGSKNRFIHSVESNIWFSLETTGLFSLIGCTVAPAFEFEDLEIAPKNWKPSKFKGYL